MSAHWPKRWTGISTLVRDPIAVSHRAGVEPEVVGADVGEHGRRTGLENRVQRGDEGERACQHLIARRQVEHLQGRDKRSRAVVHGDAVTHADDRGEVVLEPLHHLSLGQHARREHPIDECPRLGRNLNGRDGNHAPVIVARQRPRNEGSGVSHERRSTPAP